MIRLATNLLLLVLAVSYIAAGVLVPGFAADLWAPYAGASAVLAAINVAMEIHDA